MTQVRLVGCRRDHTAVSRQLLGAHDSAGQHFWGCCQTVVNGCWTIQFSTKLFKSIKSHKATDLRNGAEQIRFQIWGIFCVVAFKIHTHKIPFSVSQNGYRIAWNYTKWSWESKRKKGIKIVTKSVKTMGHCKRNLKEGQGSWPLGRGGGESPKGDGKFVRLQVFAWPFCQTDSNFHQHGCDVGEQSWTAVMRKLPGEKSCLGFGKLGWEYLRNFADCIGQVFISQGMMLL